MNFAIDLLIDESGSMYSRKDIVISGLNEFLQEQRKKIQATGGQCTVSMYFFSTDMKTIFEDKDIFQVLDISTSDYEPDGCTALHDAFGEILQKIKDQPLKDRSRILLVMTDGQENSSVRITPKALQNLIEDTKDDVKIVYMGSNQDAIANGQFLGADLRSSLQYSDDLLEDAIRATSQAIGRVVTGESETIEYTQCERETSV